jgi:ubiquinone/menaquinone biosynthesis C-methylase UbiE
MTQDILDVCCGSRMFHFDKSNPRVVYCDIRHESHILCDGRVCEIKPDVIADFTSLPFGDGVFNLVLFDPPHLERAGPRSWMAAKYGKLKDSWPQDIKSAFAECFRVLRTGGTLVFKWNETQIRTSVIAKLAPVAPVVGHISGKQANTHWLTFIK